MLLHVYPNDMQSMIVALRDAYHYIIDVSVSVKQRNR